MLDRNQLAALSAILRLGSFEAAAAHLHVTQSAISQRIRALEERIGQPLILRGTPCTGTEAGRRLARHAEDVALLEARATAEVGLAPAPGHHPLRIAVNADSLAAWIVPALAQAQAAAPHLRFDVTVDDQDHSTEWLRRGEVVAAVTAAPAPPHGCDAIPLGRLRYLATAAPGFMARHFPAGVTVEAAGQAPCMTYDRKDRLQAQWLERYVGPGLQPPSHYLPSTQAFIDGAAAGLGWGMNPEPLIAGALRAGRLVPLLPDAPLDTPLFWQVSRRMAPALAEVTQAMRDVARRLLPQA